MLTEILNRLNTEWLPQPLPPPLSAIKAAGSTGQARKINFLVFAHKARRPIFLLKTVRGRAFQDILKSEYEKLVYLHTHSILRTRIPRPVGLFKHEQTLVMVETCLPGAGLENLLRRGKRRLKTEMAQDLNAIQSWLIDFQRTTTEGALNFRGQEEVLERLAKLRTSLDVRLINELNALAAGANGISIPLTARHGDFWAGNILVSAQGIGIIDWDTLRRSVSPFDDLFFFAVMYAHGSAPEKDTTARFTRAFLKDTVLARGLAGMVQTMMRSLSLPTQLAPLFFLLFLFDLAGRHSDLGRMSESSDLPWLDFISQIHSLDDLVMAR
jgi:hypothetical protein